MRGAVQIDSHARRVVVVVPDRSTTAEVVERLSDAARRRHAGAHVDVVRSDDLWQQQSGEKQGGSAWEFVDRLRRGRYDLAVVAGDGTVSPHAIAYLLYLAGISERIGVSAEFAGKVLTRQVRPAASGVSPPAEELLSGHDS